MDTVADVFENIKQERMECLFNLCLRTKHVTLIRQKKKSRSNMEEVKILWFRSSCDETTAVVD